MVLSTPCCSARPAWSGFKPDAADAGDKAAHQGPAEHLAGSLSPRLSRRPHPAVGCRLRAIVAGPAGARLLLVLRRRRQRSHVCTKTSLSGTSEEVSTGATTVTASATCPQVPPALLHQGMSIDATKGSIFGAPCQAGRGTTSTKDAAFFSGCAGGCAGASGAELAAAAAAGSWPRSRAFIS